MTDDEPFLDKDEPQQLRTLFNRSPHPYHQLGSDTQARFTLDDSEQPGRLSPQAIQPEVSGPFSPDFSFVSATSPSDSGTEADDEKPLLKALAAPPVRPRKGLKGLISGDGATSSWSISSGADEEKIKSLARQPSGSRQKTRRDGLGNPRVTSDSRNGLETRRRLFEIILFTIIAWVSLLDVDPQARASTDASFKKFLLIAASLLAPHCNHHRRLHYAQFMAHNTIVLQQRTNMDKAVVPSLY